MKELREIETQDKFTILSEKITKAGGSTMSVLVPWTQADKKNINRRVYSFPLLQREVDRVQKTVESGAFIGTGDHPAGGLANIATSSHLVKKIWLDKGGRGWAQMEILDTERGKNVQSLIKAGAQLGISSRGFGNVAKDGRVLDDYKLMGIDIVMAPSEPTATFTKANIFESVNNFEDEGKVKKTGGREINKRAIENILKLMYSTKVSEFGYDGSYEDFAKKNRISATAKWLCQEYPAKFLTVEQALKYLGVANKFADEEKPITHYEPTPQLVDEAFMLGITVEEYVKKLNETAGQRKRDIPAEEAEQAGLAGETKLVEKMLEYPDGVKRIVYVSEKVDMHEIVEKVRKIPPPLTEEEELAKEAQRIFRIEKATNPKTEETVESIIGMLKEEKRRVLDEKEALRKNKLAEQIKESVAAGSAGELRNYKE